MRVFNTRFQVRMHVRDYFLTIQVFRQNRAVISLEESSRLAKTSDANILGQMYLKCRTVLSTSSD